MIDHITIYFILFIIIFCKDLNIYVYVLFIIYVAVAMLWLLCYVFGFCMHGPNRINKYRDIVSKTHMYTESACLNMCQQLQLYILGSS